MKRLVLLFLLTSTTAFGQYYTGKKIFGGGHTVPTDVVVLPDGSFLFTGQTSHFDTIANSLDSITTDLIRTDTQLNPIWAKRYASNSEFLFWNPKPSADGNYFVGGYMKGTQQLRGGCVLKISPDGDIIWKKVYKDSQYDMVLDIFESADNTLVIFIQNSGGPVKVLHTDANGNIITQQEVLIDNNVGVNTGDVCTDGDGNFYLAGRVHDLNYARDVPIIVSLSVNGLNWIKKYNPGRESGAGHIGYSPNGRLTIAGTIAENADLEAFNPIIMETDLDGNILWMKEYIGLNDTHSDFNLLNVLEDGSILAGGRQYSQTGSNALLLKLNSVGEVYWTTAIAANHGRYVNIMKPLPDGRIICGTYTQPDSAVVMLFSALGETTCSYAHPLIMSHDITASILVPVSYIDLANTVAVIPDVQVTSFMMEVDELCPASVGIDEKFGTPDISVFPNPSSGMFHVNFDEIPANASLRVFDTQGKMVKELNRMNQHTRLDLSDQPPGLYLLRILTEKGVVLKKVILQ